MVTRIKNVNPVQLGLVYAVLYALIGLIAGVFVALLSLAGGGAFGGSMPGGMGLLSIIIFPVMYGVIGFIAGIIGGFLYNLVAGWTGGIELTLSTAPTTVTAGSYAP